MVFPWDVRKMNFWSKQVEMTKAARNPFMEKISISTARCVERDYLVLNSNMGCETHRPLFLFLPANIHSRSSSYVFI
jgi:hypothetical protein